MRLGIGFDVGDMRCCSYHSGSSCHEDRIGLGAKNVFACWKRAPPLDVDGPLAIATSGSDVCIRQCLTALVVPPAPEGRDEKVGFL